MSHSEFQPCSGCSSPMPCRDIANCCAAPTPVSSKATQCTLIAAPQKRWYLEYYYPNPNVRFGIEVDADTQDEARAKGAEVIRGLRTVACHDAKYK